MSIPIIEGPYLRDILDQPRALRETAERLTLPAELGVLGRRLAGSELRRVVLTGMGSSLHGLVPLQLRLVAAGLTALAVDASELLHYQDRLLDAHTLLVLVSQSGRSVEIVRLLDAVAGRDVATVGITNTPGSPLAVRARVPILTYAGEEATVACKSSLATIFAGLVLGEALSGGESEKPRAELAAAIPALADYLAAWRTHVETLAPLLDGVRAVYYAGRGRSLAAALAAGLITKESTHVPAEGMTSAAFRHGPMELLGPSVFLLVFAGEARTRGLNEALVRDARAAGARAFLAADDAAVPALRLPAVSEIARPLAELLPVEMLTLALAAASGREAGRFELATKVTSTE